MTKRCISPRSVSLIKWLLEENTISERVMENTKDKAKYKIISISPEGTIILGKTSFRWLNQLLACQDKIPFESFALKVWSALVDLSDGLNKEAVLKGLSQEIVLRGVRELKYDWVVERLFDAARYICQKSSLASGTLVSADDSAKREADDVRNITINIGGIRKTLHFKDCIGDPLIDVDLGITDVNFRHGK